MTPRNTLRAIHLRQRAADLLVIALTLAIATVLLVGTFTMHVRGKSVPGPTFFPMIVSIFLYVMAFALAYTSLRVRVPEHWHSPDISADMLADFGADAEIHDYEDRVRSASLSRTDEELEAASAAADPDTAHPIDWTALAWCLGGLVLFVLLLEPLGWVLSAAMLFFFGTRAFGSRRPLVDLGVGLLLSSFIQLLFSAGLGLTLPSGFIGRIF